MCAAEPSPNNKYESLSLQAAAVNALFNYPPFFSFASKQARSMMVKRGDSIGVSWQARIDSLASHDWQSELAAIRDGELQLPEYYQVPFHAYKDGNLSWQAAWEVDSAAQTVHSPIFDAEGKVMDPRGDARLRSSYNDVMVPQLKRPVKDVLDMGCATGLSTLALRRAFPDANITGVDLSPFFLAVGAYDQRVQRAEGTHASSAPVRLLHAAAEDTGLEAESVDLVSMCLVCHELPRDATKRIMEEAMRVLRPGGAIAIMEMDPNSAFVDKLRNNLFAFTALKSTEPYLDDYMTFPIVDALKSKGLLLEGPERVTSPRHRTLVAYKP